MNTFRHSIWLQPLVVALSLNGAAQTTDLVASPASISPGQKVTLTWRCPGGERPLAMGQKNATEAFLSGIGTVNVGGTVEVGPSQDEVFTLVCLTRGDLGTAEATVTVSGRKGQDDFPADDDIGFRFPREREFNGSIVKLLARIHKVLQDDLKFSVKEFKPKSGPFTFITNRLVRPDLAQKDENYLVRRIAFRVTVPVERSESRQWTFTVTTLISQRRLRRESWEPESESNQRLFQEQADDVAARITALSDGKTHTP